MTSGAKQSKSPATTVEQQHRRPKSQHFNEVPTPAKRKGNPVNVSFPSQIGDKRVELQGSTGNTKKNRHKETQGKENQAPA